MSPAETLRAAAELIDLQFSRLPYRPWGITPSGGEDGIYWCVTSEGAGGLEIAEAFPIPDDDQGAERLARWIAQSPMLIRMFGEYLNDLAQDAEEMAADMRAVALAEIILVALEN